MSFLSKFIGLNKVEKTGKYILYASIILAVGAIIVAIIIKV